MSGASSIKEVMDPYEWLPGYGENLVEIRTSDRNLILDVGYEDETGSGSLLWRSITFHGVPYFSRSWIPNPVETSLKEPVETDESLDTVSLSSLVAFESSQLASSWSRHLGQKFDHFRIIFMSENLVFEVVAKQVSLSEPVQTRALLE